MSGKQQDELIKPSDAVSGGANPMRSVLNLYGGSAVSTAWPVVCCCMVPSDLMIAFELMLYDYSFGMAAVLVLIEL